ncbi:2-hydroxychromene-2-carboxylate isomerase [Alterisphingorhabdus coralli]|uniref:2-hydroxychromene-2-carboxylate isomerase n=1 Tax=Alterisphingorhabdus coralli TaxID=3071408 RepID=A0AA97I0B1_9SPHN|nr:2-hydroxychromene-2-carboxylate isomerase [Parasphingorhabdus sp. SCSIO 66989]WOE75544.1 2-hydroxychromene-2-carboxylate isomerase [Parasphingorhabdus sp. SCSIO 66989]
MPKTVEFLFDFASPNGYLVHRALPAITADTGIEFEYSLALLGGIFKLTGNQAPMVAFGNIPKKLAYEQLEIQRFVKKYAIDQFQFNPNFPINTVLLMRGALLAEKEGRLTEYIETGLQHMWERGTHMGDKEAFAAAMTEEGFDGDALVAAYDDAAIKQDLMERTQKAVDRGAFGIPTFFVGDEMFFGKERLGQVVEAALAE